MNMVYACATEGAVEKEKESAYNKHQLHSRKFCLHQVTCIISQGHHMKRKALAYPETHGCSCKAPSQSKGRRGVVPNQGNTSLEKSITFDGHYMKHKYAFDLETCGGPFTV